MFRILLRFAPAFSAFFMVALFLNGFLGWTGRSNLDGLPVAALGLAFFLSFSLMIYRIEHLRYTIEKLEEEDEQALPKAE